MFIRNLALVGALAGSGCGGAQEMRDGATEGEKMACIVAMEGAVRNVEKFDEEIGRIVVETQGDIDEARGVVTRFKVAGGQSSAEVKRYCSIPSLQMDKDVQIWLAKFIGARDKALKTLAGLLGKKNLQQADTLPMGPEI